MSDSMSVAKNHLLEAIETCPEPTARSSDWHISRAAAYANEMERQRWDALAPMTYMTGMPQEPSMTDAEADALADALYFDAVSASYDWCFVWEESLSSHYKLGEVRAGRWFRRQVPQKSDA